MSHYQRGRAIEIINDLLPVSAEFHVSITDLINLCKSDLDATTFVNVVRPIYDNLRKHYNAVEFDELEKCLFYTPMPATSERVAFIMPMVKDKFSLITNFDDDPHEFVVNCFLKTYKLACITTFGQHTIDLLRAAADGIRSVSSIYPGQISRFIPICNEILNILGDFP